MNLIDTNIGNPHIITELVKTMLLEQGYKTKDIFSGYTNIENLPYQRVPKIEFEELIRFYYDKILNRPLTQTDYVVLTEGTLGAANCVCWSIQKLMGKTCLDPLKIYHLNEPPTYTIFNNLADTVPNCIFNHKSIQYKSIHHNDTTINNKNNFNSYFDKSNYILNSNYDYIPDVSLCISPNNPTGEIINERLGHWQLIDSVYDVPLFTGQYKSINKKLSNNEIHLESLSKLGVPSYRFGWFITNDPMIYSKAHEYKKIYSVGQNIASYSMAKHYIELIHKTQIYDQLAKTTVKIFNSRRKQLTDIFTQQNINELVKNEKNYVPYMFLPISKQVFNSIGVDTRQGQDFFYSNNYSRINLMMKEIEYNKMVKELTKKLNLAL